MYQDVFVEELIKRRTTGKTLLAKAGIILAGIIVMGLAFFYVNIIFSLVFLLVVFGWYLLLRRLNREYEYIFTNGDLDIDRIAAKRWRKRMLDVNTDKILVMAPYTAEFESEATEHKVTKTYDFSSSANTAGRWFFIFDDKDGGIGFVAFEPSERLVSGMKSYLRSRIKGVQ